jgi:hypothetical protein
MRGSLSHARFLAAAVVVIAVFAATVSSALATSATSSANGLAVTASLSPDTVSGGQTVTQSESVKNISGSTETVAIRIAGPRPSAAPSTIFVKLAPNATFLQSTSFPASLLSKGSHSLTVTAVNRATGNGAQASASVTVN